MSKSIVYQSAGFWTERGDVDRRTPPLRHHSESRPLANASRQLTLLLAPPVVLLRESFCQTQIFNGQYLSV